MEEDLTVHHIIFRSRRHKHPELKSHALANLITLCWRCHRRIHDGEMQVKRVGNEFYFSKD